MLVGIISALSVLAAFAVCVMTDGFYDFHWLWMLPACFFGAFIVLILLWLLLVIIMSLLVDIRKEQKKNSALYRTVMHWSADALITLLRIKITATGIEKLPKDGRFLLVCNHINDLDPVLLMTVFRKSCLAFISKRENDQKFIIGPFLHKMLCQPVNRENDREALKTILRCIEIIKEDKASIGVFPEGYVSLDRMLHPFRPGVFKIAQRAEVPIVVCTLRGTCGILPNAKKLKPSAAEVHLLEVIPPEELKGVTTVQIAERVHALMAADLGPENVLK